MAALWLRRGGDLHAGGARERTWRVIALPARVERRNARERAAHGGRLAHHPGARRGDDHHHLPVDRLLPAANVLPVWISCTSGWRRAVSASGAWYQSIDRCSVSWGAAAVLALGGQACASASPATSARSVWRWLAAASNLILVARSSQRTVRPCTRSGVPVLRRMGIAFLYYCHVAGAGVRAARPRSMRP